MSPFPMSKVRFKLSGQDEWADSYFSKRAATITRRKKRGLIILNRLKETENCFF